MKRAARTSGPADIGSPRVPDNATCGNGANQIQVKKKHRRRKRRRRHNYDDDEPFILLFAKVGVCVLVTSLIVWHGIILRIFPSDATTQGYADDDARMAYADDYGGNADTNAQAVGSWGMRGAALAVLTGSPTRSPAAKPTLPPFPIFDIDSASASDNFGLVALLENFDLYGRGNSGETEKTPPAIEQQVKKVAAALRAEFAHRYGGENAARYILQTATSTFSSSSSALNRTGAAKAIEQIPMATRKLANRLLLARESSRPFKISFGGYSVTAGRGNLFSQSYPFVMERLLAEPVQLLGISSLQVRNAALGGVPSFPYGFCLDNFLGYDADVVSWDFSMNEAGGRSEGLESYLRHALSMKHSPMLLVKDTHTAEPRRNLLQRYAELGFALDTLVVHSDPAAEPFVALSESILPSGFKDWRKFGAPPGAPGQARHHPARKEHELIGWIVAMHFLSAIELAAYCLDRPGMSNICNGMATDSGAGRAILSLPPPTISNDNSTVPTSLYSLFYGSSSGEETSSPWTMNDIACYTAFEPALTGNLSGIIVGGIAHNTEGLGIMLPKGAQFYNSGWVLDLGDAEKKAKRKLQRYGGLGFVDSKKAYYGVNASGTLEMFLPLDGATKRGDIATSGIHEGAAARKIVQALIVCEVNEKRGDSECNIEKDVAFVVGGLLVDSRDVNLIQFGSASYLGKPICVSIAIPTRAVVSGMNTVSSADGNTNVSGLSLKISVRNRKVSTKEGACSVSHVVYQLAH